MHPRIGGTPEFGRVSFRRKRHNDTLVRKARAHRFDRRSQVAVAGDQNRDIKVVIECIIHDSHGNVHISLLLLILEMNVTTAPPAHLLRQKMAIVDRQPAACKKSVYIQRLALR